MPSERQAEFRNKPCTSYNPDCQGAIPIGIACDVRVVISAAGASSKAVHQTEQFSVGNTDTVRQEEGWFTPDVN